MPEADRVVTGQRKQLSELNSYLISADFDFKHAENKTSTALINHTLKHPPLISFFFFNSRMILTTLGRTTAEPTGTLYSPGLASEKSKQDTSHSSVSFPPQQSKSLMIKSYYKTHHACGEKYFYRKHQ